LLACLTCVRINRFDLGLARTAYHQAFASCMKRVVPMSDESILYLVVRHRRGQVAHKAIGSAIVEADMDAGLIRLALRKGIEPLATFYADSPAQAEHAKQTLADLGDVEFDDKDFEPTWFDPAQGIEALNGLLEHGRVGRHRLSERVRRELELLGRTLAEVRRRSCQFYLVEVRPGEDVDFAGLELDRGQG